MGEAKRRKAAGAIPPHVAAGRPGLKAILQKVVDEFWHMLEIPKQRNLPMTRADLLALLFERAMLLGGFTEAEQDRLLEIMEDIDRRVGEAVPPPPPGEPATEAEEIVFEQLKQPIDPERMRVVEERGRAIADVVHELAEGGLGFVVVVFELGNRPELTYVSNCDRRDILTMLREMIGVLENRLDMPPGVLTQRPN